MSKTVAFVQARMSSSRLPGKILKYLNGKTVVEHLVMRLKHSKLLDDIVVLTSSNYENDRLCEVLDKASIRYFRGSEEDVLGRFIAANKVIEADKVVRITADSPFICPEIVDSLIRRSNEVNAEYGYLSENFAEGVDCEVINAGVLTQIGQLASLASEREHVTLYLFNHPSYCAMFELQNSTDDSTLRFTLDTPQDWRVVTKVAEFFGKKSTGVSYEEIKSYFNAHPEVYGINTHIQRNEGLAISLKKEHVSND